MSRGDKDTYSDKQKRKAEHIEESYENKGVSKDEAEKRAWATVNKQSGGGENGGSGSQTSERTKQAARKDSANKAVATKHGISREKSNSTETKESLLKKARGKNIAGRSSMSKQQLANALAKV
ncbi:MAG: termination factor Rho [Cellvibrio sp.]|uniref:termination factor Rho n=1 Tax=Cellvibrio sp. TaxID=1965322 RepID=UPI0027208343|nr:termination factor Rho [Cellvibrio sp.]